VKSGARHARRAACLSPIRAQYPIPFGHSGPLGDSASTCGSSTACSSSQSGELLPLSRRAQYQVSLRYVRRRRPGPQLNIRVADGALHRELASRPQVRPVFASLRLCHLPSHCRPLLPRLKLRGTVDLTGRTKHGQTPCIATSITTHS
jgi:hypothetical protein